jgi:hypothetical protein
VVSFLKPPWLRIAHLVIHHGVAHFDWTAAHFTVFDIRLAAYRNVKDH